MYVYVIIKYVHSRARARTHTYTHSLLRPDQPYCDVRWNYARKIEMVVDRDVCLYSIVTVTTTPFSPLFLSTSLHIFTQALLFSSESYWRDTHTHTHTHYQSCRVSTCINRTLPIVPSFPPPAPGTLPTFESNLPPALRLPSTLLPLLPALNRENYLHAYMYLFRACARYSFVCNRLPCHTHTKEPNTGMQRERRIRIKREDRLSLVVTVLEI